MVILGQAADRSMLRLPSSRLQIGRKIVKSFLANIRIDLLKRRCSIAEVRLQIPLGMSPGGSCESIYQIVRKMEGDGKKFLISSEQCPDICDSGK